MLISLIVHNLALTPYANVNIFISMLAIQTFYIIKFITILYMHKSKYLYCTVIIYTLKKRVVLHPLKNNISCIMVTMVTW